MCVLQGKTACKWFWYTISKQTKEVITLIKTMETVILKKLIKEKVKQFSQFQFAFLPVYHLKPIWHGRRNVDSTFPNFLFPSYYFFPISLVELNLLFN